MAKELNTKTSTASSSATSPEKHIKKKVIKKIVKKEAEEVKPQPKKVIKKKIIKKVIKKVPASSISGATGPISAAGIDATISPVSPLASAQPQGAVQQPASAPQVNNVVQQPQVVQNTPVNPLMGTQPQQQVPANNNPLMNQPQMMNQGMGPVMQQKPVAPVMQPQMVAQPSMQQPMPQQQMMNQSMGPVMQQKPVAPAMQPQMQTGMQPQQAKPSMMPGVQQGMPVQKPMPQPQTPAPVPAPQQMVKPTVQQKPMVQPAPAKQPVQPQVQKPAPAAQQPAPQPQGVQQSKQASTPVNAPLAKPETPAMPDVKKEIQKSTSIFEPIRYTHVPSVKLLNVSFKPADNFLNSKGPVKEEKKEEEKKVENTEVVKEETKVEEVKEEPKKEETPSPAPVEVKEAEPQQAIKPVAPQGVQPKQVQPQAMPVQTPQQNKQKPLPLSALQDEVKNNTLNQPRQALMGNMNKPVQQMPRGNQMMGGKVIQSRPMMVQQPVAYQPAAMGYQPVQYPHQMQQHINMPAFNHQNVVPGPPQGNNAPQVMKPMRPALTPEQKLEQELAPDPKPNMAPMPPSPGFNNPNNGDKELLDKIKSNVTASDKPQSLNDVLRTSLDSEKDVLKTDEEDLLAQFVYNHPNRIITGKINFAAVLFSPIYYMYRKLLIIGLIDFTVVLGLLYFDMIYYAIGAWVVFGILFKYIYLTKGRSIVKGVIKKKPKGDSYELSRLCQKKGGTSFGYVLLGLIAELIVLLGIGYLLVGATFFPTLSKFLKSYNFETGGFDFKILKQLINDSKPNDDDKYKEIQSIKIIPDASYDITKKFEITVPETFEDRSNVSYQFRYFDPKTSNSGCSINMYAVSNYKDDNEFIQTLETSDGNSVASKKTINKIPWQFYVVNSEKGNEYYYATYLNDDKKTIVLKYEAQINSDGECEKSRESIVESIKIK